VGHDLEHFPLGREDRCDIDVSLLSVALGSIQRMPVAAQDSVAEQAQDVLLFSSADVRPGYGGL
jgi:hypothetical protein